jgi:DNA-binding beta-propeller fold protein YncE
MVQTTTAQYELVPDWEQLPSGMTHRDVAGVAVDSRDRVFLITRSEPRVLVYDRDGRFVTAWGEAEFTNRTHGITIGPDDSVYCVDDGAHTVGKYTPDGVPLLTLGTKGRPSDTGYTEQSPVVRYAGPPFNRPTNLAVAPSGDLYVSDGYGNARVHRFSSKGELLQSWGEPGTGEGQFNTPHGIWVHPDGRVFVADRENDRVQIFSPDGEYLSMWTDIQRPTQVYMDARGRVYVSELWWRAGQHSYVHGPITQDKPARTSVFDSDGNLLARFGSSSSPCASGSLCAPHSLCADSHGDIYVAEVTWTFVGKAGIVPADCHTFQKFARKA